jgi:DNA-binding CsgD family transcriptional regulator
VSSLELELAEISASTSDVSRRGEWFLAALRRHLTYDAAWIAVADAEHPHYRTVAADDLDVPVRSYLEGPVMAADIEVTGTHSHGPPLSPSDLPYPSTELRTWAECLVPAGIHEALAVALFEPGGRHVGFLALLFGARTPPPPDLRRELARVTTLLGAGMDPIRGLATAARVVEGATAGVVLHADGQAAPMPGLDPDRVLRMGEEVQELAFAHLREGHTYTTFLWPTPGRERPRYVRVTVIAATSVLASTYAGMVLVSPAPPLRGLTARELEVLGYVVGGCSNQEISHRLVLSERTVATHLEHILAKLEAPSRTVAAVRAFRDGLYVPVIGPDRCAPAPRPRRR